MSNLKYWDAIQRPVRPLRCSFWASHSKWGELLPHMTGVPSSFQALRMSRFGVRYWSRRSIDSQPSVSHVLSVFAYMTVLFDCSRSVSWSVTLALRLRRPSDV